MIFKVVSFANCLRIIVHDWLFASVGVSDFVCTYLNNEMQTGSRPYFRFSKETGKVDTLDAVTVNEQIFINRKILWDDGRETQAKGGVNCLFSMMDAGFLTNPSLDTCISGVA